MDKDTNDYTQVFDLKISDTTLSGMVTRRATSAKKHWNKEYNLDAVRKTNKKLYTTEYINEWIRDKRYEDIYADNRMFVAIRSILSFVSRRLTEPEVIPANGDDLSIQFAADFERVMVNVANDEYARDKVKLAVQDVLRGQRVGVLKWCYDPDADGLSLEHIDPDAVVISEKGRLHDEPDFVQHNQEKTVGQLLRMFPGKEAEVKRLYNVEKGVPSQLEAVKKISENWMFIDDADTAKSQLCIVWMAESQVLGAMTDPNWCRDRDNIIQRPMSPFMFLNVLNDGSGKIDHTSFIEQAQYSQKNYDKRGQTIAENAAFGGVGVPVFGKGAIKAPTAAKVRFSPVQRIMLDTADVTKSFTTWNTGPLPAFIQQDKTDLANNVDNIFGTPNIFKAQNTGNPSPTLGQDVLLQDMAEGRQVEIVDCVDNLMSRFYQIEAQLIYRYFDEDEYYNFIGEDGKFESILINNQLLSKNLGIKIRVKSGTSIPVDRSQKRFVAIELMKAQRIGTLKLYKELGIEDADETFKQYLTEKIYPFSLLEEEDKIIFSREAAQDMAVVIGGEIPEERDDIEEGYIDYLNQFFLTNKFKQLTSKQQARVKKWAAEVMQLAQEKMQKLQGQQQKDNPMLHMGTISKRDTINYKDAPPDIQRQLESAVGFQPSAMGLQAMPYQLPKSATTAAGQMNNTSTAPPVP